LQALDLRQAGNRRFEAAVAEPEWPAFPAAQLAAAAVVAAERCFPGYSVGHLSCAFGQPPRAAPPVGVAMTEIHASPSCVTGRLEFSQDGVAHGESTVVMRPAERLPGPPAACARGMATAVGRAQPAQVALVPWELRSVPGTRRTWSRFGGSTRKMGGPVADGTAGRALLAYLSELLPLSAAAVPYPSSRRDGMSAAVLSHAITYDAPFDVRDWLLATVDCSGAAEGYVHTLTTYRTRQGTVAATVSQAAVVWGHTPRHAGAATSGRHLKLI
jgi:hypothetical protein